MSSRIVVILLLLLSQMATAQNAPTKKGKKPKQVMINFEDELVRGSNEEPSVENIFAREEFNFKKMIKIRQNFIPEAKQATEVMHGK